MDWKCPKNSKHHTVAVYYHTCPIDSQDWFALIPAPTLDKRSKHRGPEAITCPDTLIKSAGSAPFTYRSASGGCKATIQPNELYCHECKQVYAAPTERPE